MDLNYSKEELAFRDEVRGWLKSNLPTDLRDKIANYEALTRDDLLRWHRILAKKGWVAPAWPQEWGGTGWSVVQRYLFEEECGYAGTPPLIPFGLSMCGRCCCASAARRRRSGSCRASTTARISGARAIPSPARGRTWLP